MLRLDLSPEPEWVELGQGVAVRCAPIRHALVSAARGRLPELDSLDADGAEALSAPRREAAWDGLVGAIAELAILEWRGVADAGDRPLPVTPEGVAALLELIPLRQRFAAHVGRWMVLAAEKNVSAPAPNGTSAGA